MAVLNCSHSGLDPESKIPDLASLVRDDKHSKGK